MREIVRDVIGKYPAEVLLKRDKRLQGDTRQAQAKVMQYLTTGWLDSVELRNMEFPQKFRQR